MNCLGSKDACLGIRSARIVSELHKLVACPMVSIAFSFYHHDQSCELCCCIFLCVPVCLCECVIGMTLPHTTFVIYIPRFLMWCQRYVLVTSVMSAVFRSTPVSRIEMPQLFQRYLLGMYKKNLCCRKLVSRVHTFVQQT